MFRSRISTAATFTALAIALLGCTPAGHAAGRLVQGKNAAGTAQPTKGDRLWTSGSKSNDIAVGARCQSVPVG